jgi:hypothetical protein
VSACQAFEKGYQDALRHAGVQSPHSAAELRFFGGALPPRISGWAAAEDVWVRAVKGLQPVTQFDSLASLEAAVSRCVRVGCGAMARLCPAEMQMSLRKLMKEAARGGMNTLRAGMDPRGRHQ